MRAVFLDGPRALSGCRLELNARPALLVLTQSSGDLARRIARILPNAELHGLNGRVSDADVSYENVADHLGNLYEAGRPIIGICAAGILIRALGPHLRDKHSEPPVLAVSESGDAVVPLLGGHAGANDLAERIGEILGVPPAITTAGDTKFGVALNNPPRGWRLANPQHYKSFVSALLCGKTVRLVGKAPWLRKSKLALASDSELIIRSTYKATSGSAHELLYHPACLAVGVGCERGVDPDELIGLVRNTVSCNDLATASLAGVFSIGIKSDEPAIHCLAAELNVPARFFDSEVLEMQTPRLTHPSERVYREVGCHGVAEAAALAAAGPASTLLVPKTKSKRATCAIARSETVINATRVGTPQGRLSVVGIGPGDVGGQTLAAKSALSHATHIVGYALYLELVESLTAGKTLHAYRLGQEVERVAAALDLAAAGETVALICSGDAGIFAMASLVFEQLDNTERTAWNRVAITVIPGVSALQATAARVGAPLGHDFCAISLSDLLTPWKVIERRLRAAAEGDFVVALYNPVSKRRTWQLGIAVKILRQHRPDDTPVVLGQNLGREGERVVVIRLDQLRADDVNMLTTVLIGSSETRQVARKRERPWIYTPRGYAGANDVNSGSVSGNQSG